MSHLWEAIHQQSLPKGTYTLSWRS